VWYYFLRMATAQDRRKKIVAQIMLFINEYKIQIRKSILLQFHMRQIKNLIYQSLIGFVWIFPLQKQVFKSIYYSK
jgi:hypothetical protein